MPNLTAADRRPTWAALPLWARPMYAVSHPAMLFPVAIFGIVMFGSYDGVEITYARMPLFLQGGTDEGGSDIFAATVALYAIFGVLGAMYLTLRLWVSPPRPSYRQELLSSLWLLRFHFVLFVIFGMMTWPEDRRIQPNDFRNMFVLAATLYVATVTLVTFWARRGGDLVVKLAYAPLFIYFWLVVGADGNTAKAGQVLNSGDNPVWQARGVRHGIMLQWHQLCDTVLGDISDD